MQEQSSIAQYIKQNSEISSRERKAARRQVVRIKREEIHGDLLWSTLELLSSLIFESFDGMAPWNPRYEKIVQGRKFARKIEEDMYCGSEMRDNS